MVQLTFKEHAPTHVNIIQEVATVPIDWSETPMRLSPRWNQDILLTYEADRRELLVLNLLLPAVLILPLMWIEFRECLAFMR